MTSHPFVSIVIPVHNAARSVSATLQSVFNQSFTDFEVLCINDASTDETSAILKNYSAAEPRLHVLSLPRHVGAGHARNMSLAHIHGAYIRFIDADDVLPANSLHLLCNMALKDNSDIIKGQKYAWSATHRMLRPCIWPDLTQITRYRHHVAFAELAELWGCFDHQTALLRADMVRSAGATYRTASNFQDPPFMAAVYTHARTISVLPENVYVTIGHAASLSRRTWAIDQYLDMLDGIEHVFTILEKGAPAHVLAGNASRTGVVLGPRLLRAARELSAKHLRIFLQRIKKLRENYPLPFTCQEDSATLQNIFATLDDGVEPCISLLQRSSLPDILPAPVRAEVLQEELTALRRSLSWKITAPLRWGLRFLRGY